MQIKCVWIKIWLTIVKNSASWCLLTFLLFSPADLLSCNQILTPFFVVNSMKNVIKMSNFNIIMYYFNLCWRDFFIYAIIYWFCKKCFQYDHGLLLNDKVEIVIVKTLVKVSNGNDVCLENRLCVFSLITDLYCVDYS